MVTVILYYKALRTIFKPVISEGGKLCPTRTLKLVAGSKILFKENKTKTTTTKKQQQLKVTDLIEIVMMTVVTVVTVSTPVALPGPLCI